MRVLIVEPGPNFSVQDVYAGWRKGFERCGVQTVGLNYSNRLDFYHRALIDKGDGAGPVRAMDDDGAVRLANKSLQAVLYEYWPDVVVVVSSFYVDREMLELIRSRGHRVVLLFTESPYEDDRQFALADCADIVLLNDPQNILRFRDVNPHTYYAHHCYDPDLHRPADPDPDLVCDFGWVGTCFPSRLAFFEQVDWSGMTVRFGGGWSIAGTSPLLDFVQHPLDQCLDNAETVRLYQSSRASANLYRKEANDDVLSCGWAMGPREVELAACGTFFLRERRGEGDELLPMLPTFDGPDDFTEKLRWWLAHDDERAAVALKAREAIAARTFDNSAAHLLQLVERL